jgi:hypothetical protein
VVIEVPGGGVVAEADVDARVGSCQRLTVARPDHLDVLAKQHQGRHGEHLVSVEGAVVGRDQHGPRL